MPANAGEERGGGQFQPGQSGNPSGRAAGARNKVTLALEALMEGEAEALGRKAVELALAGDTMAMKLCLERVFPVRRGRPIRFALPAVTSTADVVKGIGAVLSATATGELTPDEAATIAGILETKRRSIEVVELDARIAALEAAATERTR